MHYVDPPEPPDVEGAFDDWKQQMKEDLDGVSTQWTHDTAQCFPVERVTLQFFIDEIFGWFNEREGHKYS
jgi:hypothetical protein